MGCEWATITSSGRNDTESVAGYRQFMFVAYPLNAVWAK